MRASFVAVVVTTAILSPALALAQTPQQDLSRALRGDGSASTGFGCRTREGSGRTAFARDRRAHSGTVAPGLFLRGRQQSACGC